jgi:putative transposase
MTKSKQSLQSKKQPDKRCKAWKFRLYPTHGQVEKLEWTLRRCCELYNAAVQERRDAWKMCQVSISFEMQSAQLPSIKQEREEYKDVYAQVLQDVLHRVDKTFNAFFERVKHGQKPGYPRYKGNDRYDSFTYPQAGFEILSGKLHLSKIGHIKIKLHREMKGTIRTCTIKREGSQVVCGLRNRTSSHNRIALSSHRRRSRH